MELPVVKDISKELNIDIGASLFLILNLFPDTVPFMIETALKTQYHEDPIVDTYDNIYIFNAGGKYFIMYLIFYLQYFFINDFIIIISLNK